MGPRRSRGDRSRRSFHPGGSPGGPHSRARRLPRRTLRQPSRAPARRRVSAVLTVVSVAHAVVIAGGGPTGLMLAGELALAGVDVVIVERRTTQAVDGSRAGGLLSRTIEVLDQRGIADRFLSKGRCTRSQAFGGTGLDISDFPTRHNYVLGLWQSLFEPILADWVDELGVPILRGREVVGFAQDDTGVDVELSDDTSLRASTSSAATEDAAWSARQPASTSSGWIPREAGSSPRSRWPSSRSSACAARAVASARRGGRRAGPGRTDRTTRRAQRGAHPAGSQRGADRRRRDRLRAHSASWISRFTDMSRQAVSYREGRVLLAGDAAHVHPPHGGQGLNTGVQDAVNLGWKLAQVVNKTSPESLLDTYHDERHPVGARVLHNTMAQVALTQPRRPPPGPARHRDRAAPHGRAAQAHRRDALRPRHPLRPR